jgi:F-type H+-transporting ATPase subunit delta
MSELRIAYRYAEALLTAAEERQSVKQVRDDLTLIRRITKESRELQLFLKSPVVKKEKKQEVLEAVFAGRVQELTLHFIRLLTEKEREGLLLHTIDAFFRLHDSKLKISHITVNAAGNLSEEQIMKLANRFEAYTGKKVYLHIDIDKRLVGGFVARIDDVVLDGSVKRQLETLQRRFIEERSIP